MELLTEHEAAERLAVSTGLLRKFRRTGGGPAFIKVGASVRYSADDLSDFIEKQRKDKLSPDHTE